MSTYQDIYINHVENHTFKHHLSVEDIKLGKGLHNWGYYDTLCGINLESLAQPFPAALPDDTEIDPNWYFEHERDDVIACHDCLEKFTELFSKDE